MIVSKQTQPRVNLFHAKNCSAKIVSCKASLQPCFLGFRRFSRLKIAVQSANPELLPVKRRTPTIGYQITVAHGHHHSWTDHDHSSALKIAVYHLHARGVLLFLFRWLVFSIIAFPCFRSPYRARKCDTPMSITRSAVTALYCIRLVFSLFSLSLAASLRQRLQCKFAFRFSLFLPYCIIGPHVILYYDPKVDFFSRA
jgi:hypothetical protein